MSNISKTNGIHTPPFFVPYKIENDCREPSTPPDEPVEDTFISDPPEEETTRDYDEEPAEDRDETQATSESEEQPRKSRDEDAPANPPPSSSDNKRRRIAVSMKQSDPGRPENHNNKTRKKHTGYSIQ